MHLNNISLILEGGGMRGMFSAGVFEAFLNHNLTFPHIAGVSAGACNILSYMSQQKLRTRKIITTFVGDDRYCSFKNWLRTGSLFGFDFILKEIPRNRILFDYDTFFKYPGLLEIGTTDCQTGESVWYTHHEIGDEFLPVRASASLPFFAPIVEFGGRKLLDGALMDPIPYDRGIKAGFDKFVIVLTRNEGYRKKKAVPDLLAKAWYPRYPKLQKILAERHELYNRQLETVERMAKEGRAVIIRPVEPLKIERLDLDKEKLAILHDQGTACGEALIEKILELNNK